MHCHLTYIWLCSIPCGDSRHCIRSRRTTQSIATRPAGWAQFLDGARYPRDTSSARRPTRSALLRVLYAINAPYAALISKGLRCSARVTYVIVTSLLTRILHSSTAQVNDYRINQSRSPSSYLRMRGKYQAPMLSLAFAQD